MPEDVETGGQPQLRRGVSKTGRMAEFGCDILLRGPPRPATAYSRGHMHARYRWNGRRPVVRRLAAAVGAAAATTAAPVWLLQRGDPCHAWLLRLHLTPDVSAL